MEIDLSTLNDAELIMYAESIGFVPDWLDDGESILGVAVWVAPNGETHVLTTLRDAVLKALS